MSWQQDQRRADYLEALYAISGRADRRHPNHGLYTGLFSERLGLLVETRLGPGSLERINWEQPANQAVLEWLAAQDRDLLLGAS